MSWERARHDHPHLVRVAEDGARHRAGNEEDLALLAQEARRCREILRKLNSLGTQEAHVLNVLAIETLIEEVVEPLRDQEVEVIVTKEGPAPLLFARAIPAFYMASAILSKTRSISPDRKYGSMRAGRQYMSASPSRTTDRGSSREYWIASATPM